MSLRIAMVGACPYPVPQGSQTLLKNTAEALAAHGHHVHLITYSYSSLSIHNKGIETHPDQQSGSLYIHRCRHIPGMTQTKPGPSWGKPLADIALAFKINSVVRREKIDIIHAHNYEGLISSLATHTLPIVYHAHNSMKDELPHFIPYSSPLGVCVDKLFPRHADYIIAPHDQLAEYLKSSCGCKHDRVSVIPPYAEWEKFEPRDNFGECPGVLYTGNLDTYQNLPLLLSAMSLVRRELPHAKLYVATASSQQIPFAEMIYVPDFTVLRNVLGGNVIVVSPRVSWSGYPIKLLNAMAAGRPIVACAGASPCITDGETGVVVADNDSKAMAEAIIRLYKSPELRRRLGINARRTAETQFSASLIVKRIEKVYETCLKNKKDK